MRNTIATIPTFGLLALTSPAAAQKLGKGGTGIDEMKVSRCERPLGSVVLIEIKTEL